MSDKNGYTLTRTWFDWCKTNSGRVAPAHTALYMLLIDINNRTGWRDEFPTTTAYCMHTIGIRSRTTFISVFNDLIAWNFVRVISRPKNQFESFIITLPVQNLNNQNENGCPKYEQPNTGAISKFEQPTTNAVSKFEQPNMGNDELTGDSNGVKQEYKTKNIKRTAPTHKKFIPPTVDEVRSYCTERRNHVDAELFIDYYTANGWTQGHGKPIRDWRACVRTWEKRNNSFNNPKNISYATQDRKLQPCPDR
jgi:hypothetical protein